MPGDCYPTQSTTCISGHLPPQPAKPVAFAQQKVRIRFTILVQHGAIRLPYPHQLGLPYLHVPQPRNLGIPSRHFSPSSCCTPHGSSLMVCASAKRIQATGNLVRVRPTTNGVQRGSRCSSGCPEAPDAVSLGRAQTMPLHDFLGACTRFPKSRRGGKEGGGKIRKRRCLLRGVAHESQTTCVFKR